MLEIDSLQVAVPTSTGPRTILHNINFQINKGELAIILGSNGAGKSTLLKAICGQTPIKSGDIRINGASIVDLIQPHRVSLISTVPQDPKLATVGYMTVAENLSLAYSRGKSRGLLPHRAPTALFREKLAMLNMGLENRLSETIDNLSGGQRQALSLVMAVIAPAALLVLDEITAALHHKAAKEIMNIVSSIVKHEKLTTLMVSHNLNHILEHGDKVLLMDEGKITKEYAGEQKKGLLMADLAAI